MRSRVQVLVATMNQVDSSLLDKMNIQTDAIVGNQCDRNNIRTEIFRGKTIQWLDFAERGVGRNRNNALMRASADIVLFADDDMTYVDGYEEIVIDVFRRNPDADVVVFNINETIPKRTVTVKEKYTKKSFYGAARLAARRESLFRNGLFFNLCFGGGADYSCGEDSIFVSECQRKGLRVLLTPIAIATLLDDRESSWFNGYTDKYYRDNGTLLAAARVRFPHLKALKSAYGYAKQDKHKGVFDIYKLYAEGIKEYNCRETHLFRK